MQYVTLERAVELGNSVLNEGMAKWERFANDPAWQYCALRAGNVGKPSIPRVVWKKKGYGLAGTAFTSRGLIEMNSNYLHSPDALKFIRNTMLHELAHILNGFYGGYNHDSQWKEICHLIGDDGGRCHDYRRPENAPEKKRKTLKRVDCGKEYEVTQYRYDRYLKYRCRCHGDLIQL